MNIKVHASLVLAACTVAGLALGGFLANRYQRIEDSTRKVGPASWTMKEVRRLSSVVGNWVADVDMVFERNGGLRIGACDDEANKIRRMVAEIGESELAEGQEDLLATIRSEIGALASIVLETRNHTGSDRQQRIAELANIANRKSNDLTRRVENVRRDLERRAKYRQQDLGEERQILGVLALLSAFAYFVTVWICWLWIVHRVVKPIEDLSEAAGAADHEEREFVLPLTGPDEVRRLTDNISSFVSKLQDAKANTEEEVRQRTEELEQASQAKGAFIATMSHELRTPLNGIINMNELILDTSLDAEQTGFAKTAKNAAEALLSLINDILDYSKIEARKLELEAVAFDMRSVVDGAVDILAGVAEGKSLELQAVVAPEVPASLIGDPMRLRQVLINLLSNALKFTPEGAISVVVAAAEETAIDATLRIEVSDSGIGIPEDRRCALFRAFEQVDSSTTRKYGGTGLGLAICREMVGLMGGVIDVDSTVGVGSTFWFTVRLGKAVCEPQVCDISADGVVVVARRATLRRRLMAQLRFLGLPEAAVVGVKNADEVRIPAGEQWLAVVDPYQRGNQAPAEIQSMRELAGVFGDRLAVLDHWMRHWSDDMGRAPEGVVLLKDPTCLDQLREWLAGQAKTSAVSRAAEPEEQSGLVKMAMEAIEKPDESEPDCLARILIAEDNAVNQRVVRSLLERSNYEVVIVDDGQQALDAFVTAAFDLVLMDCQMPVMDGLEATRRIRSVEFERTASSAIPSRIPIVALTANAEEGFSEQCFEAGMDRFLSKPCRKKPLLATLEELLGDRQREPVAGARVLVADDSPINRKVVQSVLGRAGYELVLVENGQEALDRVQSEPFALVLMDCQMPVLDGLAATRRIRDLETSNGLAAGMPRHLPIVALTGNASAEDRQAVADAGMDRHVSKPFRPTELLAVVTEFTAAGTGDRAGSAPSP